jgi:hypothetical protein
VLNAFNPRRIALGAVKRLMLPTAPRSTDDASGEDGVATTPSPTENPAMARSRDRILANLDDMYREAFEAAKADDDDKQMRSLDFAYRREQLYFEILLDIRDAMAARRQT